jgi:hypothetical protein
LVGGGTRLGCGRIRWRSSNGIRRPRPGRPGGRRRQIRRQAAALALVAGACAAFHGGTTFISGSGTGQQTIPLTRVTYWSGPATATTGTGTLAPGQAAASNAVDLTAGRVAFSLTGGSGIGSASWNPTLSVQVPAAAIGGTYTATITESVS